MCPAMGYAAVPCGGGVRVSAHRGDRDAHEAGECAASTGAVSASARILPVRRDAPVGCSGGRPPRLAAWRCLSTRDALPPPTADVWRFPVLRNSLPRAFPVGVPALSKQDPVIHGIRLLV